MFDYIINSSKWHPNPFCPQSQHNPPWPLVQRYSVAASSQVCNKAASSLLWQPSRSVNCPTAWEPKINIVPTASQKEFFAAPNVLGSTAPYFGNFRNTGPPFESVCSPISIFRAVDVEKSFLPFRVQGLGPRAGAHPPPYSLGVLEPTHRKMMSPPMGPIRFPETEWTCCSSLSPPKLVGDFDWGRLEIVFSSGKTRLFGQQTLLLIWPRCLRHSTIPKN